MVGRLLEKMLTWMSKRLQNGEKNNIANVMKNMSFFFFYWSGSADAIIIYLAIQKAFDNDSKIIKKTEQLWLKFRLMIKNELSSPKQNAGIKKTLKKKKVNSNCMQKLHLHQLLTLFSSIEKSTVK